MTLVQGDYIEEDSPSLVFSGDAWSRVPGAQYSGGYVATTEILGDSVSLTFNGSSICFVGTKGRLHGSYLVDLDGKKTFIEAYSSNLFALPKSVLFCENTLDANQHTIKATNFKAGPQGSTFHFDAFVVKPHTGSQPHDLAASRAVLYPVYFLALFAIFVALALSISQLIKRRRRGYSAVASKDEDGSN